MAREENSLPPKMDINLLVTRDEDVDKVLNGRKTATRRNDRYADKGDVFELQGQTFVVNTVYQQKLGDMTDADAKAEGHKNLDSYQQMILAIHEGMEWDPDVDVWVHEYSSK